MTAERPPIDLARPDSWPVVLTLPEVACIIARKVGGIRKDLAHDTFVPAPFAEHPYRWRREDVTRWLRQSEAA